MATVEKTQIEMELENVILSAMMARIDPKFEYTADEIVKQHSDENLMDAFQTAVEFVIEATRAIKAENVIGIIYDRVQDNLLLAEQRDNRSRIILPGQ